MRTPDQYREFVAQCYRLAAEAKTEVHQKMMEEMARAWNEVAEQTEKREGSRRTSPSCRSWCASLSQSAGVLSAL
jgi:hypothetical protein